MSGEGNGTPVTWRELNLLVEPMQTNIAAIGSDVKLLLTEQAKVAGALGVRHEWQDQAATTRKEKRGRHDLFVTIIAAFVTACFASALTALLYAAFAGHPGY